MGKGSTRRREDRARVAANWDAIFAPKAVESGFAPFVKHGRPAEPGEVADVYESGLAAYERVALKYRGALNELADTVCPKCGSTSGNDWSQCSGSCPMPMSPHFTLDRSVTPD